MMTPPHQWLTIACNTLTHTTSALIDILLIAVLLCLSKEIDKEHLVTPIMSAISWPFVMHLYPVLIRSVTMNYTEMILDESSIKIYEGIVKRDTHFESIMIGAAILGVVLALFFTLYHLNKMIQRNEPNNIGYPMRRSFYAILIATLTSVFAHNHNHNWIGATFFWNSVVASITIMVFYSICITWKLRKLSEDSELLKLRPTFRSIMIFGIIAMLLIFSKGINELYLSSPSLFDPLAIADLSFIPRWLLILGMFILPPYNTRMWAAVRSISCKCCCFVRCKSDKKCDETSEVTVENGSVTAGDVGLSSDTKSPASDSAKTVVYEPPLTPPPAYDPMEDPFKEREAPPLPEKEAVNIVA